MSYSTDKTANSDFSEALNCLKEGKGYEYTLKAPGPKSRELINNIVQAFLKEINLENAFDLLCLCLEEIISNSVKANIKRAYFISNNLDINNQNDYEKGMQSFKEQGMSNTKDAAFVEKINNMGLYVKILFKIENNYLFIITRNNSVISKQEIERINKKLKLSENKTPEDIFMNSIDQTEGAGLGIIMIQKIMTRISTAKDCFKISANETETITELKIVP